MKKRTLMIIGGIALFIGILFVFFQFYLPVWATNTVGFYYDKGRDLFVYSVNDKEVNLFGVNYPIASAYEFRQLDTAVRTKLGLPLRTESGTQSLRLLTRKK